MEPLGKKEVQSLTAGAPLIAVAQEQLVWSKAAHTAAEPAAVYMEPLAQKEALFLTAKAPLIAVGPEQLFWAGALSSEQPMFSGEPAH